MVFVLEWFRVLIVSIIGAVLREKAITLKFEMLVWNQK